MSTDWFNGPLDHWTTLQCYALLFPGEKYYPYIFLSLKNYIASFLCLCPASLLQFSFSLIWKNVLLWYDRSYSRYPLCHHQTPQLPILCSCGYCCITSTIWQWQTAIFWTFLKPNHQWYLPSHEWGTWQPLCKHTLCVVLSLVLLECRLETCLCIWMRARPGKVMNSPRR